MEYHLHVSFHRGTILVTVLCYAGCYLLALLRCRRRFRKMNIHGLMNAKRQNEEIREKHESAKRLILPLSVFFIFLFWAVFGRLSHHAQQTAKQKRHTAQKNIFPDIQSGYGFLPHPQQQINAKLRTSLFQQGRENFS